MQRLRKQKISSQKYRKSIENYEKDSDLLKDQEFYYKASRTLTLEFERPSLHKNIIRQIDQTIKRPKTSTSIRKDFIQLKNLMTYKKELSKNQEKNINRLRAMKSLSKNKQIENQVYMPLGYGIKSSQQNLKKKRLQKFSHNKLNAYYHKKMTAQNIQRRSEQSNIQSQYSQYFSKKPLINETNIIEAIFCQSIKQIKKNIVNTDEFKQKIALFGLQFIQKRGQTLKNEAKSFIDKINSKQIASYEYQRYALNHFLLKKLMIQIYNNPKFIKLINQRVYRRIKQEMVSQLTSEKKYLEILKKLQQLENYREKFVQNNNYKLVQNVKQKTGSNSHKRSNIQRRNQNKILINQKSIFKKSEKLKQQELITNFDQIFQLTSKKIDDAAVLLHKPIIKHNNFILVQQKQNIV